MHDKLKNRILAALTQGVLSPEAGEKSGTLLAASLAMEIGREVFVVPGNIDSPASFATNRLMRTSAEIVLGPRDILERLGYEVKAKEEEALPEEELPEELLPEEPLPEEELWPEDFWGDDFIWPEDPWEDGSGEDDWTEVTPDWGELPDWEETPDPEIPPAEELPPDGETPPEEEPPAEE